jgi:hypothetical protein
MCITKIGQSLSDFIRNPRLGRGRNAFANNATSSRRPTSPRTTTAAPFFDLYDDGGGGSGVWPNSTELVECAGNSTEGNWRRLRKKLHH